jgi:lysophospholipase L1-like esterase
MAREALVDGGSRRAVALCAAALVSAFLALGPGAAPAAARDLGNAPCAIPNGLLGDPSALPHVAARLRAGQPVKIVAIGSSSTGGAGASSPAHAYPAQLQDELSQHFPDSAIVVLNKGINGQRTPEMMARFERDVFAQKPDLVIWQVGTNSIIQSAGVAQNEALLHEGIARLRSAGVDIILMNPQFAPKVTADPDYPEMLRIIDRVSESEHVMLFPRFAIMHHWVTSGQARLDQILSRDGLHMNDLSYGCVAGLLADQIDLAVRGAERQLIAAPQRRP